MRLPTLVLSVTALAALPVAAACSAVHGGGGPEKPSAGAVYVLDSTGKLFSFDESGAALGSVAVPSPVGDLNGGGITRAGGLLYVTIGKSTNAVRAFSLALAPSTLGAGAFSGLDVPRGIAFDPSDGDFYVGNAAPAPKSTGVYDDKGASVDVASPFPGSYGMSGVAFDADDDTIWVANYVGAPSSGTPAYGVAEYTEDAALAQTFDYGTQFVAPRPHEEPFSIAVCPGIATGGGAVVVVGFLDDGSGMGSGAVQAYSTSGAPLGHVLSDGLARPYALSCGPNGNLYIADKLGLFHAAVTASGLIGGTVDGAGLLGLTPPIFGVLLNVGGGGPDAGGHDATTPDSGPSEASAEAEGGEAGGGADAAEAGGGDDAAEGGDALDASEGGRGARDGGHDAGDGGGDASDGAGGDASDAGDSGPCTGPSTPGVSGGPVTISPDKACNLPPTIAVDTTLSASVCPVYHAPKGLLIGGKKGPVLTIGPGVAVAFGTGKSLVVGSGTFGPGPGGLAVGGSTCQPVVFTSDGASPTPGAWGVVDLESETLASSSIDHLTVQYAGHPVDTTPTPAENCGSCASSSLLLDGLAASGGFGADFQIPLSDVTLSNNAGNGFAFLGAHTGPSAASSGALTVTDWLSGDDPFNVDFDAAGLLDDARLALSVGSLPAGTVHLVNSHGLDGVGLVDQSEHWPSLPAGWSYVVGKDEDLTGAATTLSVIVTTATSTATTLTVDAPNTLLLGNGFLFDVDGAGTITGKAALVAKGSAGAPLVFGGLGLSPKPGSWQGFLFNSDPAGQLLSTLDDVTIDSAGSIGGLAPVYGAVWLFDATGPCVPGPALSGLTITHLPAAAYGVLAVDVSKPTYGKLETANPGVTFYNVPTKGPPHWQCQ